MSNLKRSRPHQQDAVLKKLQEISSTRMDSDSHADMPSSSPEKVFGDSREQDRSNADKSLNVTEKNRVDEENMPREISLSKSSDSSNAPKCIIPNLTFTPDSNVFTSNSDSVVSSTTSSPKLPTKSQLLVKGLYALSVSDTSVCPTSQSTSPRTKILPSFYSPKLGRRFESLPDYKSASSSPTSPSRKFFRLMSSPTSFAGGMRRGSEPLLDGKDLNEVQMSMTDRRWEKLRSILTAMKNEPFDSDTALGLSTPDLMSNLKENIDRQEEFSALRKELSALHVELDSKNIKLNEALNERNVALAYIKKLKLADKDLEDENKNKLTHIGESTKGMDFSHDQDLKKNINSARCSVYAKEIESLKKEKAEKEDVFNLLTRVVEELRVERSYLNHLMSVVLDRAPWMLDEVDKGGHWMDGFVYSSDDDDEVWC